MKNLIKKIYRNDIKINHHLMSMYNNPDSDSIAEYKNDVATIASLQRTIRQYIKRDKFNFYLFFNKYTLLKNVFGLAGILYIASEYFTESDEVYEIFCSLVYYIENGLVISNRRNNRFLELMRLNDKRKK